jgi:AcrR family transcriptional regulator
MGRPSKVEEKRVMILDAFEEVILREGFGQASQRKIALQAGIKQPMIHHYFGGGDAMLDALLARVVERYMSSLNTFADSAQAPNLENILGFVCSPEFHQVSEQNEVFFSCMVGAGDQNKHISAKVSSVYEYLLELIIGHLEKAQVSNSKDMGYVVMCLILGHDWARRLGFGEGHNKSMFDSLTKLIET